jgi:sugar lactone lactonase YvrE
MDYFSFQSSNLTKVILYSFVTFCYPFSLLSQNLLIHPESIIFDEQHNRYLVTCNGNGKIISIDNSGVQDTFKTGFSNLLGSHISGNTIYVSSNNGVQGFDLTDTTEVFHVPISGLGQIDGITSDNAGNLYVIDGIYRRIYRINISAQTYNTFVNSGLPTYAQDCIFDADNNRLLVVAWAHNAPIQAVSLLDSTVSLVVNTTFGYFDGITTDQFGNVYVSSHYGSGRIYKYDKNFTNPPELISSGHNEPAGLGYNTRDNILAVPNYGSHSIDYIFINPNSINNDQNNFVNIFRLYHNFPNPFNPKTTISYYLPKTDIVNLSIYNLQGQKIKTLESNIRKSFGNHSVIWDGTNEFNKRVSSGYYLYRIETTKSSKTKSMIFLK